MTAGPVKRALLWPKARSLPWRLLAAAGGLGLLLAVVIRLTAPDVGPDAALTLLRMAALCGALGVAFVLDDPARETTAVLPVPRAVRQVLRLSLVLPLATVWWVTVLGVAGAAGLGLPVGTVTLETAALFAMAFALASMAVRFTGMTSPGPAVAGTLLALIVSAAELPPDELTLFVPAGGDGRERAHLAWALLLALAVTAWAACGREPRRPRWR
ncbi:ABC transporter [Streptomyces litchfieldiae]|uniref:ABC transporter n=1 Tax=Streptomyces litchfieldiae TaxID=3075543 RepID=A0ABU2MTK1_9ACTN|nr:ABC transporter [Streptomyces sp. DSM 44938]MDT0344966.1 ABC transporter [Streptomyces sp. DSM 44938]